MEGVARLALVCVSGHVLRAAILIFAVPWWVASRRGIHNIVGPPSASSLLSTDFQFGLDERRRAGWDRLEYLGLTLDHVAFRLR